MVPTVDEIVSASSRALTGTAINEFAEATQFTQSGGKSARSSLSQDRNPFASLKAKDNCPSIATALASLWSMRSLSSCGDVGCGPNAR
jgi:hypothetical protein